MVLPQLSDSSAASSSALLLDQVGQLEQQPAAVGGVHRRPGAGFQRAACRFDRPVHVLRRGRRHLGDHFAGGRVVGVERAAFDRIDPLIVDEQFGLANGRRSRTLHRRLRHGITPHSGKNGNRYETRCRPGLLDVTRRGSTKAS